MKLLIRIFLVLVLVLALGIMPTTVSAAWWYGAQMTPTTSTHDVAEMPAAGLYNWNTVSSGQAIGFWVGDSNTVGFAQLGFNINKGSGGECQGGWWPNVKPMGTTQVCQSANSWALFWTFCTTCSGSNQVYYGNVVRPLSGWQPTDQFYFSVATYTTKGEYSFLFEDQTRGQSVTQAACSTALQGPFSGLVGGITESGSTTNVYGTAYVQSAALWAEVLKTSQSNSGNAHAVVQTGVPSNAHITILASNDFDYGFQTSGSHYSNGQLLWNGGFTRGLQYVPADLC